MDMCRTCLKTPAEKHISELRARGTKECNKDCFEIMKFCLDIVVAQDSQITTNLCSNCYRKIISFYKFKVLSLKNDSYLKSLDPVEQLEDQELSVYVDENGIKHENVLDSDEFGPTLIEDCDREFKVEVDVKSENSYQDIEADINNDSTYENLGVDFNNDCSYEDFSIDVKDENILDNLGVDDEPPSVEQNVENEDIEKGTKEIAPVRKRGGSTKKTKSKKKEKWKPARQVCEECGMSVLNIKEHSLRHKPKEERRKLQCKACPKTFFSIGGRKKHYRVTHLGLKSKCDICGKEIADLKLHMKVAHNPEQLPYGCVQCSRRFVTQYALDVHMVMHTKDLRFECDQCHKRFGAKHLLGRHILHVHEKIRSHQCQLCTKSFFKKERLKAHVSTHTNERPYTCEDCGKAFTTKDYLKEHLVVHSGVKRFQCQHCDMTFSKQRNMKTHMISHTKEKRYPCGFCGVRFGRSDHRNRHELTAHKKRAD